MKKTVFIIAAVLLAAAFSFGCVNSPAGSHGVVSDGRARPSSCGRLMVSGGRLCSESGDEVMLRGVSLNGLITSESFLNDALFAELAE